MTKMIDYVLLPLRMLCWLWFILAEPENVTSHEHMHHG